MGIPAGLFMKRFGYKNGVLFGLSLLHWVHFFVPAANLSSFAFFGLALFILGCGLSTLETVAHPFVGALGDQRTSDQRINFAQAFNAVGAMIGPALGGYFLFAKHVQGSTDLTSVKMLYLAIGTVIAAIAIAFSFVKVPPIIYSDSHSIDDVAAVNVDIAPDKSLFSHQHFVWSVIAQFFNVAAQSGTWAFFINYGHDIMGFTELKAANFMVLFMGMMLVGRFIGTFLMRVIAPNALLAIFAFANILMCIIVAQNLGWPSFIALLMINFFFSIMFPTIFSLGLKNLGSRTQQASSFISMGVVGGAFFLFLWALLLIITESHMLTIHPSFVI